MLSFVVKSENIYKECFSLKCAQDCTTQVIDHFELKMNIMFWSIVSKLKSVDRIKTVYISIYKQSNMSPIVSLSSII